MTGSQARLVAFPVAFPGPATGPEWSRCRTGRFTTSPTADDPGSVANPCLTAYPRCMTMLSFRVDDRDAQAAQRWAEALGVDRSELLREALRRHLDRLASERDADRWAAAPLEGGERSLADISDWGLAEDWSDWAVDAAG